MPMRKVRRFRRFKRRPSAVTGKVARGRVYRPRRLIRKRYPTNIPEVQKVALKYSELFNVQLAAGNLYTWNYVFRPNDLFDPNFTGVGHQAMCRDQWYQLYSAARCIGFKFKFVIYTDSDSPVDIMLTQTDSSSTISFEPAVEWKGSKVRTLQKYKPVVLYYNGYVDQCLRNRKGTCLIDDTFKQTSGVPLDAKSSVWLQMGAISRASSTANIWTRVHLVQFVRFMEPIWQLQS